jgi:hypothetical protein
MGSMICSETAPAGKEQARPSRSQMMQDRLTGLRIRARMTHQLADWQAISKKTKRH